MANIKFKYWSTKPGTNVIRILPPTWSDADHFAYEVDKKHWACWVIDRADQEPIPKLFVMPWTLDKDICACCFSKTGKIRMPDAPDKGYDVIIEQSGQRAWKRYNVCLAKRASPIIPSSMKDRELWLFNIAGTICMLPVPKALKQR